MNHPPCIATLDGNGKRGQLGFERDTRERARENKKELIVSDGIQSLSIAPM